MVKFRVKLSLVLHLRIFDYFYLIIKKIIDAIIIS